MNEPTDSTIQPLTAVEAYRAGGDDVRNAVQQTAALVKKGIILENQAPESVALLLSTFWETRIRIGQLPQVDEWNTGKNRN